MKTRILQVAFSLALTLGVTVALARVQSSIRPEPPGHDLVPRGEIVAAR